MPNRLRITAACFAIGLAAALAAPVASGQPASASKVEGPAFPPAGTTWVIARRDSGSFGTGSSERSVRMLGEHTWQDRKVIGFEGQDGAQLLDAKTGWMIALVSNKGVTLQSMDPGVGWEWPLWVGKSWVQRFSYTDHRLGQTSRPQAFFRVEAEEEVKVPAGTFKALRISYSDGSTESSNWLSLELRIIVKSRTVRTASHGAGSGVREFELVSFDLKR